MSLCRLEVCGTAEVLRSRTRFSETRRVLGQRLASRSRCRLCLARVTPACYAAAYRAAKRWSRPRLFGALRSKNAVRVLAVPVDGLPCSRRVPMAKTHRFGSYRASRLFAARVSRKVSSTTRYYGGVSPRGATRGEIRNSMGFSPCIRASTSRFGTQRCRAMRRTGRF